ncbi:hypothetical protein C8Q75DRAFT_594964 [Abortiporus biennis]|nr:hypothetical protein C8Q75DRAFT_594964 [Abortiporus biennis]
MRKKNAWCRIQVHTLVWYRHFFLSCIIIAKQPSARSRKGRSKEREWMNELSRL